MSALESSPRGVRPGRWAAFASAVTGAVLWLGLMSAAAMAPLAVTATILRPVNVPVWQLVLGGLAVTAWAS